MLHVYLKIISHVDVTIPRQLVSTNDIFFVEQLVVPFM